MTNIKSILAGLGLIALTACSGLDTATRAAPLQTDGLAAAGAVAPDRDYAIGNFTLVVPEDLVVSESDSYYPLADIVWRGDPIGDRRMQIAGLFEGAADRSVFQMRGGTPVDVEIALVRFHGVTERTRYSFGGVYNIIFDLTVTHAGTGEVLEPTRRIEANLDAPGGMAAIMLDQQGQTEKVRVTDFLTMVLNRELTAPTGNQAEELAADA